jgi:hypothetical protein
MLDVLNAFSPAIEEEFLDNSELCLIEKEMAFCYWQHSRVIAHDQDNSLEGHVSPNRTSKTAHEYFFPEPLVRLVRTIEKRVAARLHLLPSHFESWQMTRYRKGDAFSYHHDAGSFLYEEAGERLYTTQIYLNTPGGCCQVKMLVACGSDLAKGVHAAAVALAHV